MLLGSTMTLFIPPAFAVPAAIPHDGTFPDPASPADLANEAAGAARKIKNARAIFAGVLGMTSLHFVLTESICVTEADLGPSNPPSAIKLNFRMARQRTLLAGLPCVFHLLLSLNQ